MMPSDKTGTVSESPVGAWHCLYTSAEREFQVQTRLKGSGYDVFLPTYNDWVAPKKGRTLKKFPLFPSYLFVRAVLDTATQWKLRGIRGIIRVLGQVPDEEIEIIQRIQRGQLPQTRVRLSTGLPFGQPVRVIGGPFEGMTGTFVRSNEGRGVFTVALPVLQRNVETEISAAFIERL